MSSSIHGVRRNEITADQLRGLTRQQRRRLRRKGHLTARYERRTMRRANRG